MSRLSFLICAALAVASCQTYTTTAMQSQFYQDGKLKPKVAIIPVFDHTTPTVEWDLSEELTQCISERLLKKDKVFLAQQQRIRNLIKDLKNTQNPFTLDLAWVKPTFQGQDFVVFMELIEHDQKIIQKSPEVDPRLCSAELNISMRIRVLDVRNEQPKVVLQEIVHHNKSIPRQFTQYNYLQEAWGEHDYSISTLGLAHAQLTKEIANRIEDYIQIAFQKTDML